MNQDKRNYPEELILQENEEEVLNSIHTDNIINFCLSTYWDLHDQNPVVCEIMESYYQLVENIYDTSQKIEFRYLYDGLNDGYELTIGYFALISLIRKLGELEKNDLTNYSYQDVRDLNSLTLNIDQKSKVFFERYCLGEEVAQKTSDLNERPNIDSLIIKNNGLYLEQNGYLNKLVNRYLLEQNNSDFDREEVNKTVYNNGYFYGVYGAIKVVEISIQQNRLNNLNFN